MNFLKFSGFLTFDYAQQKLEVYWLMFENHKKPKIVDVQLKKKTKTRGKKNKSVLQKCTMLLFFATNHIQIILNSGDTTLVPISENGYFIDVIKLSTAFVRFKKK